MSTDASAERKPATRRPRLRALGAAWMVGLLGTITAIGTSFVSAGPALAGGPLINGGGSSYAAIAINQWDAEVQSVYGDSVNYNTSSSVIGLNEFAANQIDFGASEIGYSTGQASGTPDEPYQYLPDVAGATCLMYNLTGITGHPITQLLLTPEIMANIFSGQIKFWDDPSIKALNPSDLLPHTPITVVWRSDASGDNYLFSRYLAFEQPAIWNSFSTAMGYPAGADAVFPYPQQGGYPEKYNLTGWIGAQGSDIASNDVAASNGGITYVETAYAYLHDKPCAFVENASGHFVVPTELNDAVALEGAQLLPDLEQQLDGVYTNRLPDTYPISAYSYLITQEATENPQKGAVLGQYIEFLACRGQDAAGQLGYSPLPPNLVQDDFNAIDRIAGAAKAPAKPTASNCPNPYIDGTTQLPGEPTVQGGGGGTGTTGTGTGGGTTTTTTAPSGSNPGGTTAPGQSKGGSKGNSKGSSTKTKTHPKGSKPSEPTGKASGVVTAPTKSSHASGGIPGYKLLLAVNSLHDGSGPSGMTLWLALGASLVVLVVPALLLGRRRRPKPQLATARTPRKLR
jgi:phosphate transport system substrate-binding protein